MGKLYEYIFHYNATESLWYAIKRQDFAKYFNEGEREEKFLHDPEINNLLYTMLTSIEE
jgi:hypothetical protein